MEEFEKLFVENEVLKDSVASLQQQYRNVAENNEVRMRLAFQLCLFIRDEILVFRRDES